MKNISLNADNYIINNIEARQAPYIREPLNRQKESAGTNRSSSDTDVRISERALVFNKIKEIINCLPEYREDKIESVSSMLLCGEYKVTSEQIASGFVGELIKDSLSRV